MCYQEKPAPKADAIIPIMLFALGIRLVDVKQVDWKIALVGAVVCPLTTLIAVPAIRPLLQLPTEQVRQLLLYCILSRQLVQFEC